MKSPTTTIWKTVVFSAALIGGTVTLGCKNKNEATMDPCADPCKGKMSPEGGDEYGGDEYGEESRGEWDEGGDVGRGFVLS